MAYEPGRNIFNPLVVGAIAVIVALVAFLALRDGDTSQQAGIQSPPASTSPAPPAGSPSNAPTTPDRAPKGSGNL